MIRLSCCRFFSSSKLCMSAAKSSSLGKLRKTTGFSISNCKKALELYPDDIVKAEEWLHAEAKQKGWLKWSKIQARKATQGLIGVFAQDNTGVMLEVNCETDFVARNAEFQEFVEHMIKGCMNHATGLQCSNDVTKIVLGETKLNTLKSGSSTIGELVASAVSKFSEKTVAKRAVCVKVKGDLILSSFSHPSIKCQNLTGATLGKYGTLMAYKKKNDSDVDVKEVEQNVCQHIIGMNPSSLGELSEEELAKMLNKQDAEKNAEEESAEMLNKQDTVENVEKENKEEINSEEKEGEESREMEMAGSNDSDVKETNEERLLFQPYLLDSNVTVAETLHYAGIEVLDFERFECGESISESAEPSEKVMDHA